MDKRSFTKGESKSKTFSPKEKIISDEEMLKNLNDAIIAIESGVGITRIR